MIPMGLGMIAVNAGTLWLDAGTTRAVAEARVYDVRFNNDNAGRLELGSQGYRLTTADGGLVQEGRTRVHSLADEGGATAADLRFDATVPASFTALVSEQRDGVGTVAGSATRAGQETLHFKGESARNRGNLMVAPLVAQTDNLMYILQVDAFQPIYTFAFANGLIACFVFMGIGALLDLGFVLNRPFQSMFLAFFAEFGTLATFPIAVALGLTPGEAASIAMVGGADGPMVLFTSLMLAKDLFVPITVVAYLYLGLTYGGYPWLIRLLIPKRLRGIPMDSSQRRFVSGNEKLAFAVVSCLVLCLLLPVAAPLILSLFLGIAVREAGLKPFTDLLQGQVLYLSTMVLGLVLGLLCDAGIILDPRVLALLALGILSLLLSGIGAIAGGYVLWYATGGRFNPVVGIAAVSCVPTCAKVAQKEAAKANPSAMILPHALGANVCGVITSAVFCAIYVQLIGAWIAAQGR
jgi:oxaloacetate decarboxylase beta subunit